MYDGLLAITGHFIIDVYSVQWYLLEQNYQPPWKRRLKTMPRGILKRPTGPLKLAPLYIRAVLTIPLTRTEKQGFKGQIADKYKLKQSSELILDSANGNYWIYNNCLLKDAIDKKDF